MRALHKLTLRKINSTNHPTRLSDGGGLYLRIKSPTAKSWEYIWTRNGAKRQIGLGSFNNVSLEAAREMAALARKAMAEGKDLRKALRPTPEVTFSEVANACIDSRKHRWKNVKTNQRWRRTVDVACQALRNRPISSISREDVYQILKPMWEKTPESARIVRTHLEIIFNYAKGRGWFQGENPAQWKGGLEAVLPALSKQGIKHLASMDYHNIPDFIIKLRAREAMAARALEFCILTACRTSEVLEATFDEIDFEKRVWSIPPERTKTSINHVVPLSDRAFEIIEEMKSGQRSAFIFPGSKTGKPLSNMSMLKLLERMGVVNATVHGFRSSFRDWAGDETSHPRDMIELCLGHSVGNATERAYRRRTALERRRIIMSDWANWCNGSSFGKVVPLYG